jgi:hypothetical protein
MVAPGKGPDTPTGYYILRATSGAYQLDEDVTEVGLVGDDGLPMQLEEGSRVVDAVYLNKVPGHPWYTPFGETPCGCAGECACDRLVAGRVRVPSHMVLGSGFEMALLTGPSGAKPKAAKGKKQKAWGAREQREEAVAKGAVVLSPETHKEIMDDRESYSLD